MYSAISNPPSLPTSVVTPSLTFRQSPKMGWIVSAPTPNSASLFCVTRGYTFDSRPPAITRSSLSALFALLEGRVARRTRDLQLLYHAELHAASLAHGGCR